MKRGDEQMPDYAKKIVYLSEAQYQELITNKTITVNETTIDYDDNTIYLTPQNSPLYSTDLAEWAKAANKPTYTAQEVGALPSSTKIPTKVSELTNDAGYLTTHQDISGKADASSLAAVATSGDYEDLSNRPEIPVTDVQINGTSVLSNSIANIPVASASVAGVIRPNLLRGLNIEDGMLQITKATINEIKNHIQGYTPIVPSNQHAAVFYGLATAAGDETQDISNNIVGQYTDTAKSAIRSMLGATSSNVIAIQDTQPTDTDTKIWLPETTETPVEVPTVAEMESALAGKVGDVQVNGTSIVENGIANIPIASTTNLGVVKDTNAGVTILSDGSLRTIVAGESSIKSGNVNYNVIVPKTQHQATFYGLAKAAGDTTQGLSENLVGNYTDEAKIAIQKMLGIYEAPWELIQEETFTNEEEADHIITFDLNNNPFQLTDVIMSFELPKQDNVASKMNWGQIWYYYNDSNKYLAPEAGQWTQEANASANGFKNFIETKGDLVIYNDAARTTSSNSGTFRYRYVAGLTGSSESIQIIPNFYVYKINIKTVTGTAHYKLFGKRKWQ